VEETLKVEAAVIPPAEAEKKTPKSLPS
jgi:hypothetical protein